MIELSYRKVDIYSLMRAQMKLTKKTGFTLIELLVVIAIIAVLAVVVVLTLNPAQLLQQSRDSNRISDFATLKSAISLYLEDVSSSASTIGTSGSVYAPYTGTFPTSSMLTSTTSLFGWGYAVGDASTTVTSTLRGTGGTGSGWMPINFGNISSGAPFGSEPVDPVGTGANTSCPSSAPCMYQYTTDGTGGFKLNAKMESSKYATGGGNDIETSDGGRSVNVYEQGSNLSL